jgi:hypothetical protein
MMRHGLLSSLVVGLLGCQHPAALTQTALPDAALNRTDTVFDSPAGPTQRVEYKRASTEQLVRVEFQHLLSGRVVVDTVSVRAEVSGQWVLTNMSDNKTVARFNAASTLLNDVCKTQTVSKTTSVLSADFSVRGSAWRAYITRVYEQPKPQAGISNESEPAIDLIACRL